MMYFYYQDQEVVSALNSMKCKINITAETDIAAWVSCEAVMANVDLQDLECRESKVVTNCYYPDWFRRESNGELYFTPPAFIFRGGRLLGINGRHRAVLLTRHMNVMPMLLVNPTEWPKEKLAEIVLRQIGDNQIVELPDLPMNTAKQA